MCHEDILEIFVAIINLLLRLIIFCFCFFCHNHEKQIFFVPYLHLFLK